VTKFAFAQFGRQIARNASFLGLRRIECQLARFLHYLTTDIEVVMRRPSEALATTTFFPFDALRWGRPKRLRDVAAIAAGLGFAVFLVALAYAPDWFASQPRPR
jgi:hypothetical protein